MKIYKLPRGTRIERRRFAEANYERFITRKAAFFYENEFYTSRHGDLRIYLENQKYCWIRLRRTDLIEVEEIK